jgi:eukaryotic-like serine/threonine-protein kinase
MQSRVSEAEPEAAFRRAARSPSSPSRDAAGDAELRLLDLLGDGGSAQVWRAADPSGRIVAVKMLKPELRERVGARACLEREHHLLCALRDARIVAARGFVDCGGVPALVLEYLRGGDLVALAGSHPRHWLLAVRDVGGALAHMHARGFVHRDVKARNVLLDSDDRARLIDFASVLPIGAAAAHAGATAAHRPPGSVSGPVMPADDCYAFAALLYELLAGRLPYGRAPAAELAGRAPPWPLTDAADPSVRRLAELVSEALASAGRLPGGLSALADVIESAVAAYR